MSTPEFVHHDRDERADAIRWWQRALMPLAGEGTANHRLVWVVLTTSDTPLSRRDLAKATGLAYSTIHGVMQDLDDLDVVDEHDHADKSTLYTVSPEDAHA